jgi:cytochrome c oxidase subunit II
VPAEAGAETSCAVRSLLPLVLALALGVSGCGGGDSPPEVPPGADGRVDPVLVEGREIFGADCATCHDADGSGGRGPRLSGGRVVERYPDAADQVARVSEGGNGMPAFGERLRDAEIEAVVRYTREVLGAGD